MLNDYYFLLYVLVYSDRIFVIISQLNKFGTILKADSAPKSEGGGFIYTITTLIGKRDDPLLNIYARQIIERLSLTTNKPLLLAISILDDSRDSETFQTILNYLFQENAWN